MFFFFRFFFARTKRGWLLSELPMLYDFNTDRSRAAILLAASLSLPTSCLFPNLDGSKDSFSEILQLSNSWR